MVGIAGAAPVPLAACGDAVAVLEAARSDGPAVVCLNDGTIVAPPLAAAHPELVRSLVLFTLTGAHTLAGGLPMESIDQVLEMIQTNAEMGASGVELLAPSRLGDERFDRQLARFQRLSVRPDAGASFVGRSSTRASRRGWSRWSSRASRWRPCSSRPSARRRPPRTCYG